MSAIAIGVGGLVAAGSVAAGLGAATAIGVGGTALLAGTAAAGIAGSVISSSNAADAAQEAAQTQATAQENATAAQTAAQDQAITEQRRQFDKIQELLSPYTQAGPGALQGMQGLAGLRGAGEQQASIDQIKQSAQYQELARQGEQGILQNASATGGLRGGNVQAALAQFRPSLLNQLIESQYSKLAGLTSLGQASAAGTAAAGQQSATNIGNLYSAQGAAQAAGLTGVAQAQAGGIIGAANAQAQGTASMIGGINSGIQGYAMLNAANAPSMNSGIGTGGFAGTYGQAQAMYGGAPLGYQTPMGPGAPGGYYKAQ